MKKYCLTLDLKDDPALIAEYDKHHRAVWPEIIASIRNSGITEMEIYRYQSRLFMSIEAEDDFSFERKAALDQNNEKVAEWETLMWKYQQALPTAKPGEKWLPMDRLFALDEY